jgi:hypothetical protein
MRDELRIPALKAQAERMVEDWEGPQRGSKPAMIAVMKDLLAALAAAEQRTNSAEARMGNYRADNRRLSEARVLVQQHNARLVVLEQAARVWGRDGSARAESALLDAIEALDAPSGDPS